MVAFSMAADPAEALFEAVRNRNPDEVERLLAAEDFTEHVDVIVEEWMDYVLVTPFWVAVVNNDIRCAELLLEANANVNITVQKCGHATRCYYASVTETPLAHAAARGFHGMLDLLISYDADPDLLCIEEEANGHSEDIPDTRPYLAKDRYKQGMPHIGTMLEDYSAMRQQLLAITNGPDLAKLQNGAEDKVVTEFVHLTTKLARRVLTDLICAGAKAAARQDVLDQWGFPSPEVLEKALTRAAEDDASGEISLLMDSWKSRLMSSKFVKMS
eukprot:TRINITY_DN8521_c0_g1_i1.p1 TRINITY_DN8521_c0_g1~~TRINITY_DN8521_c0_g1_i1.p1  ORF type:complete len:272 (-),score=50.03 TRINITY_DN8521_c0_g1_i1:388-1203(-)